LYLISGVEEPKNFVSINENQYHKKVREFCDLLKKLSPQLKTVRQIFGEKKGKIKKMKHSQINDKERP
jgi:hypothetical protein